MLHVIPSFFHKISETSLFVSTNDYDKFLVCRNNCVSAHDPAFCFLKNCKFYLFLIADENLIDLLVKLDCVCFTYQNVDCFYTQFKFRFDSAATFWRKMEKSSIEWKEPFRTTNSTEEWIRCPALRKSDYSGLSSKNTCWHQLKGQFQFKQLHQFLWRDSRL